jgi:hypothetical protein
MQAMNLSDFSRLVTGISKFFEEIGAVVVVCKDRSNSRTSRA